MVRSAEGFQCLQRDSDDGGFIICIGSSVTEQGEPTGCTDMSWNMPMGVGTPEVSVLSLRHGPRGAYLQGVPGLALEGEHIVHHVPVSYLDAIARENRLLARSQTHS